MSHPFFSIPSEAIARFITFLSSISMPPSMATYIGFNLKHQKFLIFQFALSSTSNWVHIGGDLFQVNSQADDVILKQLWHYSDAIMCCSVKMNASAVFRFANQAGLDMLETSLLALQDIMLDKILDESSRKVLLSEFSKIMQQVFAYLLAGICVSIVGRPISYDQASKEGSEQRIQFSV